MKTTDDFFEQLKTTKKKDNNYEFDTIVKQEFKDLIKNILREDYIQINKENIKKDHFETNISCYEDKQAKGVLDEDYMHENKGGSDEFFYDTWQNAISQIPIAKGKEFFFVLEDNTYINIEAQNKADLTISNKESNKVKYITINKLYTEVFNKFKSSEKQGKPLYIYANQIHEVNLCYKAETLKKFCTESANKLINLLQEDGHKEQKTNIFIKNTVKFIKKEKKQNDFDYILQNIKVFFKDINNDYQLYVSEFSFEEVRDQLAEKKNKYIESVHKKLNDIFYIIISIPAAGLGIAWNMSGSANSNPSNLMLILIAVFIIIYSYTINIILKNQQESLKHIKNEYDGYFRRAAEKIKNHQEAKKITEQSRKSLDETWSNQIKSLKTLRFIITSTLLLTALCCFCQKNIIVALASIYSAMQMIFVSIKKIASICALTLFVFFPISCAFILAFYAALKVINCR